MRSEYVGYAIKKIRSRRLRSWLTVVSVLIGIAMIYTLISFGQGLSSYVDSLSSKMGKDKLIAQAGSFTTIIDENFFFTESELGFLRKMNGISEVSPLYFKGVQVKKGKKSVYAFGIGVSTGKDRRLVEETFGVGIIKGRNLRKGEKNKVVLGYNYQLPNKAFKNPLRVGDNVLINDVPMEVIGFYEQVGNPQDDTNVYFSLEGFESIFPEAKHKYNEIIARVTEGQDPAFIAEKATDKLRKLRGQKRGQEDFTIQTFEDAIKTFTNILTIINVILVLIAMISVIVAGVNIMNTMYAAVLERTKEIGIMKAVGARNRHIMLIFLVESGIVGLVGGVLGILVGYALSSLGGKIAENAGFAMLRPEFPLSLTIGSLLFSFFVGSLSGVLPARAAARQKPVDALRYE